jgi:hypothetical protein
MTMRVFAISILLLVLVGCKASVPAVADRAEPGTSRTAIDPARDYLLQSAASDFLRHGPEPARFRNVRFGYVVGAGHSQMALLCGEVEPARGAEAGKWIAFATVKTSAYEQWLGDQSGFCARPAVGWDAGDLSGELMRRVDALR